MRLDETTCRRVLASQAVARLATVGPERPHIVPIVFAVVDGAIVTAIDHKPKRTTRLQRLSNLERNPAATVLADHYEDDWSALWWVRADGIGVVDTSDAEDAEAHEALIRKYPQYAITPPAGPVIRVEVTRWSGWAASSTAAR